VQGFVLSHGNQLLKKEKRNKKQIKAQKKQKDSRSADKRVQWLMPWALSPVGGGRGFVARFVGESEVSLICKDPLICLMKSRLQALIYPQFAILGPL
jgi:hypothetical protein